MLRGAPLPGHESFYEHGLKGHGDVAQGIAGVKAPALPWATLLRPLRGLEAIFICGGELEYAHVTLQ